MLTMNALEPVNFIQTKHGLVVEFCIACDSDVDDVNTKCKELMEAYGYKQAKVGKHTYNATDKLLILNKCYTNAKGETEWVPLSILAYYTRIDSNYTEEEINAERSRVFIFYINSKYAEIASLIKY